MLKGLRVLKKQTAKEQTFQKPKELSAESETRKDVSKRDSWMTDPSLERRPAPEPKEPKKAKVEEKPSSLPQLHEMEPEEAQHRRKRVGDGGRSWRRRIERRQNESEAPEEKASRPERASWRRSRPQTQETVRSSFLYGDASRVADQKEENVKDLPDGDVDVNRLASAALKAKLRGDLAAYERIQAQILSATKKPKVEVLSALDGQGRAKNLSQRSGVQELVQSERMQSRQEFSAESAMSLIRDSSVADGNTDDRFDAISHRLFEDKGRKGDTTEKLEERRRKREIADHERQKKSLDRCWFCFGGKSHLSHLVTSIGLKVYLALPQGNAISAGHCLIVPMEHATAATAVDEDVFEEIDYFKRHLVLMFAKQNRSCIFLETNLCKRQSHCVIECIPVDAEQFADAPMYFRKAILESDEEWSQHRKLIDTSSKGLRQSVPSDFPYFHVEMGKVSFAHVIEDNSKFQSDFGCRVVCGIVEEPAELLLRPRPQSRQQQMERVQDFKERWRRFDWTRKLSRNASAKTES